jgi:predicted RNA binding protein YcfA (HicA-like mRNA interferase family)
VPKDFYSELSRLLLNSGWRKIGGGKGSHEKWSDPKTGKMVTVPRTKSRHMANTVLKQAGLPKAF